MHSDSSRAVLFADYSVNRRITTNRLHLIANLSTFSHRLIADCVNAFLAHRCRVSVSLVVVLMLRYTAGILNAEMMTVGHFLVTSVRINDGFEGF